MTNPTYEQILNFGEFWEILGNFRGEGVKEVAIFTLNNISPQYFCLFIFNNYHTNIFMHNTLGISNFIEKIFTKYKIHQNFPKIVKILIFE